MRVPRFTADASLYKASHFYGMLATFNPKQVGSNLFPQRVGGPDGPIGLPGQGCQEACLHLCMMFGGKECLDRCLSTCGGTPGGLTSGAIRI